MVSVIFSCIRYDSIDLNFFFFFFFASRLPPPTDLEMVVPAHAVGKVMGKGGANIDNIRKVFFFPWIR